MARTSSGPSFASRVAAAGLSPQQREAAAATLLLAELVDELCGLIRQQIAQLDEQNVRLAEQNELLDDIRNGRKGERATRRVGVASGPSDEGKEGGTVRITEPATPPPDPDEGPAPGDRPVAEPAPAAPTDAAAARRPAAKTARAAKKTTRPKPT